MLKAKIQLLVIATERLCRIKKPCLCRQNAFSKLITSENTKSLQFLK